MNNDDQEILYETANPILFVAGMLLGSLLGGLVGALVMLLLARSRGPRPGGKSGARATTSA